MGSSWAALILLAGIFPFAVQSLRSCHHQGLSYNSVNTFSVSCSEQSLFADFNGDGRTDFFCNDDGDNADHYYLSTIAGVFYAQKNAKTHGWCSTSEGVMMTGDTDGDGRAELICRFNDGIKLQISHFRGSGFTSPMSLKTYLDCPMTSKLLVGDVGGDKAEDFVCADQSSGKIRIHYNGRSHRFRRHYIDYDPRLIHHDLHPGVYEMENTFCMGAKEIHLGDMNGRGKLDLVCVDFASNNVDISFSEPDDGHFNSIKSEALGQLVDCIASHSIVLRDVNGDGSTDMNCIMSGSELIWFYDGEEKAFATSTAAGSLSPPIPPADAYAGDFNGDGLSDLVFINIVTPMFGEFATCQP